MVGAGAALGQAAGGGSAGTVVPRARARVEVAGQQVTAFPTPEALLAVEAFAGVPASKLERLHGVALAALAGVLDAPTLRAADPLQAHAALREIPGIGPFSASLVHLRSTGVTDVLVDTEPHLTERVGRLYGLEGPAEPAELARIAEPWRPFRTWVAVLLRAASDRLPEFAAAEPEARAGGSAPRRRAPARA